VISGPTAASTGWMPPCPILSTTATCLVYIIGGVFILDIFGVNTTSIIALHRSTVKRCGCWLWSI
jgi:hypothetical protein